MENELQDIYRNSTSSVRASFREDEQKSAEFYARLIEFVKHISPPAAERGTKLLDVGCGCGWSTYHFARQGYDAAGIDLNGDAFEPPALDGCSLSVGSAMDIPHPPQSFDVVVSYQCIEHVPSPAKALDEMVRVCQPGGIVAIVGPNLLSPVAGLTYLGNPSHWKGVRFVRTEDMPRHPYGNTLPEIFFFAVTKFWELLGALLTPAPRFPMRKPDDKPPFHADNDACYLCNPTDIIHYFRRQGFQIVQRGRPGRPPLSYLFAGGTYVAARRPL